MSSPRSFCRSRELAAKIEDLLDINSEYDSQQSRAQKLRRKVEQGERRLKAFPDCDHSRVLDEALDHEWKLNQPRREDRHRESQRIGKYTVNCRLDDRQGKMILINYRESRPTQKFRYNLLVGGCEIENQQAS
ncbi:hypothetical protein R3P38DRAFT_2768573 [Favolaschia claudopus]|uniref:Uncharacterized protein n=1 Tax=Favolaschia claudopus TaxID=2862362 RepID=A0AAW0CRR2_9AGAR